MGGRGSSSGGASLPGGGGGGVNVLNTTDLTSQREGNREMVDDTLSVLREVNEQYGYIITDTVVADIGASPAIAYYEEGTGVLGINKNYFDAAKMNQSYDDCVKENYHPSRGDKSATEAVVSHETGHALTEQAAKNQNMTFDAMSKKIVSEALNAKSQKQAIEKANKISGYAKSSNAECIAEAFADVFCNGSNAKAESQSVVNVLNKYLGGKK